MKLSHCFRVLPFIATSLLGLGVVGCIATNNTNTKISGKAIPDDIFAQIKPGQTKEAVIELVGQPSQKANVEGGSEVWKWNYTETKMAENSFIVLFESTSTTTSKQTTVVEFNQSGVVTKASRE